MQHKQHTHTRISGGKNANLPYTCQKQQLPLISFWVLGGELLCINGGLCCGWGIVTKVSTVANSSGIMHLAILVVPGPA